MADTAQVISDPHIFHHDAKDAPLIISFVLPDNESKITVVEDKESQKISVLDSTHSLTDEDRLIGSFEASDPPQTLIISTPGLLTQERLSPVPALVFSTPSNEISNDDFWKSLYALWLRRTTAERLPLILSSSLTNQTLSNISFYLTTTGLAYPAPNHSSPNDAITTFWSSPSTAHSTSPPSSTDAIHTHLVLIRSSFWQAAGAPVHLHWLRHPSLLPSLFPPITSFTQSTSPPILTTHPLRPPKPPPGAILYQRHILSLNSTLTLRHLDPSDPSTFRTYATWQNSDRVNAGWRERGDDSHHAKYLDKLLWDRHAMSVIVEWDGEPAGYAEVVWSSEDGCAPFLRGVEAGWGGNPGPWDQGTHYFVGEERFRGRRRCRCFVTHFPQGLKIFCLCDSHCRNGLAQTPLFPA